MTTPSSSDGTERTKPTPSPAADEEPLPPTGTDGGTEPLRTGEVPDSAPLLAHRPAPEYAATPQANTFAADFARRQPFSGTHLLKPGRRATVAVAGVAVIAVIGAGVAVGLSRLGGDSTVRSAATGPTSVATSSPSSGSGGTSQRPSGSPTTGSTKAGRPSATNLSSPSALRPTAPPATTAPKGGTPGPGPVPQPTAATQNPVRFTGGLIVNFASNRCLAAQGGSQAAGTQMVLADCNSNDPSQGWTFRSDGTARDFGGTMCLDVSNPGDGALVHLAQCSSSQSANQRFVLKSSYDLVDVVSDLCVDAKDKNTAAGTVLQLWTCAGTSNQKWKMP